ncbi:MAG: hypothetical protein GY809_28615 [Planctomycetes bacterium]|nr:hypothetical protein [Planctomycetota bacterium]
MIGGKYTRTFSNYHYPAISERDFGGARAVLGNRYKLVMDAQSANKPTVELFDLTQDPAEALDVATSCPRVVEKMQKQLRDWQGSVLKSLTAANYTVS